MFILADIEATCWEQHKRADNNEIIELGLLVCNVRGDVLDTYHSFVRPVIRPRLSKFCRKLTGIEQDWVDDASPLKVVLSKMENWFDNKFAIDPRQMSWVSWGDWDPVCLDRDCGRHKTDRPFGTHIDLKRHYAELRGVDVGLREAVEREGFPWTGNRHRAIDDATNSLNIARLVL